MRHGEEWPSPFRYHRLTGIEHLRYTLLMSKTLTRTICIKLDIDGHDAALAATQRAFNAGGDLDCAGVLGRGHHQHQHGPPSRLWRDPLTFGLGAQLAVCARAKAVEAIKAVKAKQRETCPHFGPRGSIRYDARTYRLMSLDRVSLNTLDGRVVCRLLLGRAPACDAG